MSADGTASHSSSIANYLGRTHRFLRKRVRVWPIIAALGIGLIGWWVRARVETALKAKMAAELRTILNADVKALETWFKAQKSNAATLVSDARVRAAAAQLVELAKKEGTNDEVLQYSPQLAQLRDYLKPWLKDQGYHGFILANREHRVLASLENEVIGKSMSVYEEFLTRAFAGQPTVCRPFVSLLLLLDEQGALKTGLPMMYVAAPVRGESNEIIAVLGLRMRPGTEFTQILGIARAGESGETYAFDKNGLLLSQSRFDNQLQSFGLLLDLPDSRSILNLELRDPEVDLRKNVRATKPRRQQELTKMVKSATAGRTEFDVDGYRDYRGVPVIGASTWLEEYGVGIETKCDQEEAYRALYVLPFAVWGVLGLLAVSAGRKIFRKADAPAKTVVVSEDVLVSAPTRTTANASTVVRDVRNLPNTPDYELFDPPFGEGAYGRVWLARNAIGQWQALKAVYLEKFHQNAEPYDREFRGIRRYKPVSDNHPGLLRVDFVSRKKREGYFSYVMELGDAQAPGWEESPATYKPRDLSSVRARAEGRRLPPQDCVRIGFALAEALEFLHRQGLTHRDIKPQNIIFVNDTPKLADVGLVAEIRLPANEGTWVGTPGYMPPPPEPPGTPQADIYALGMVLYVISTGREPAFFPEISTTLVEKTGAGDLIRLNDIILRACQPDCAQRYVSAAGMRVALQEAQKPLEGSAAGSAA